MMILSVSTPSYSSELCCVGLKLCDKAVTSCKVALDDKTAESELLKEEIMAGNKRIDKLESERNSIWNSKILWTIIGAGLTGVAVGVLK